MVTPIQNLCYFNLMSIFHLKNYFFFVFCFTFFKKIICVIGTALLDNIAETIYHSCLFFQLHAGFAFSTKVGRWYNYLAKKIQFPLIMFLSHTTKLTVRTRKNMNVYGIKLTWPFCLKTLEAMPVILSQLFLQFLQINVENSERCNVVSLPRTFLYSLLGVYFRKLGRYPELLASRDFLGFP